MQIVFYIIIYIIGVLLGSFLTLAIYRIPRNEDIVHTRSYCPVCKHRLNFLDLIPILSYLFLRGGCRYCKEKISPRYIIIEAISGVIYLLFVASFKFNIYSINLQRIIFLILITIYYSILMLLAGIEKETKNMPKKMMMPILLFELVYITYLYIFKLSIYRYIIYLLLTIVLLLIMQNNENYLTKVVIIAIFTLLFINNIMLILALINIVLNLVIYKFKNKNNLIYNICGINLCILVLANLII